MDQADWLTEQFEANRPRLEALAYRMLGSRADADDAVQETWLRLNRADATSLENLGGWLTTVAGRVCLDRLRSLRARREEPKGVQLADLVEPAEESDPEQQAIVAESVGSALLVVLDLLAPAERVAFVLHDIFAVPFDEIAQIVGRSPEAARQLASRSRRRVQGTPSMPEIDLVRHREVVDAFLAATRRGDFDALLALLDPAVELRPDESALRMGAMRATRGATDVARLFSGGAPASRLALIDGVAGLAWMPGGRIRGVVVLTIIDGRIVAIDLIGDRERLQTTEVVLVDD